MPWKIKPTDQDLQKVSRKMSKKTSRDQENVLKKFPHNLKKQNVKTIKPILFLLYTLSLRMPFLWCLQNYFLYILSYFSYLMLITLLHFTGIPNIKKVGKPKNLIIVIFNIRNSNRELLKHLTIQQWRLIG